ISFTAKVLQGDTAAAKMTPFSAGTNETLTLGDARRFNYYSDDGPGLDGMAKWGYLSDGSFMDRPWTADYVTYFVRLRLLQWMTRKDIVTFTDDDIKAGAGIIEAAIAEVPAV